MTHPTKPTVHCKMIEPVSKYRIGDRAVVFPRDHTSPYVSNVGPATTSPIVALGLNSFETMNTYYICEGVIDVS